MKKFIISGAALLLSVFAITLTSCSDDNDNNTGKAPVVKLEEVGHKNSKEAIAGTDLHLEGEILAENLIKNIEVKIANEKGDVLLKKDFNGKEFVGKKNTNFHKHIDIPETAAAGKYILTFTVTDNAGLFTTVKENLTIKKAAANEPTVELKEVGEGNSKTVMAGKSLHLAAHINAPNKIKKIVVEIHKEGSEYEKEFDLSKNYVGQTHAHFHEELAVPADAPKGNYHLHFTVTDVNGASTTEECEDLQIK
ncbi:DUF4625 domain-containing protein [Prevotella sp. OH937_COT-195]|uniref:DUF4625 domain-containing protein n=1 Tax=Prevotella sp. OH937_COT-195 TaxID=2491051 RepID=UPI000F64B5F0|nr:DUF4625 domain-containing protein [Prevotella sp. OH937_COT-195]RRD02814.1 DUF4625 domain-containing protein [Prevotella sp. OH937_COT-195]